jgi:hypothetical protein
LSSQDDYASLVRYFYVEYGDNETNEVKTYYDGLPEVDETWSDKEKHQLSENSKWLEWGEFERRQSD